MLNAFTSHDLVAFHITVRAEAAQQAIDLLSDFVARPRIDPQELDRERGVVIQEINRAYDQPSTIAEYLIDKAAFGEHPLGRTVLGPEGNLRSSSARKSSPFAAALVAGRAGGAFIVGNLEHLPADERAGRGSPLPAAARARALTPAPASCRRRWWRSSDTNQSHLRMIYRPAAQWVISAGRAGRTEHLRPPCSAGRWARACSRRSEKRRGLCYSVYAFEHAFADVPILQLGSGLESRSASRHTSRMREIVAELRSQGPTEAEVARARAYAAGRLVLAFENTGAVARHAAGRPIVFGE